MVIAQEWFTVNEAAEYLRISRRTVYKLVQNKRLPSYRIGEERHQRFKKEDLDKVPNSSTDKQPPVKTYAIKAREDPVLAELWVNEKDAAYDTL
jgi:excisionase family DNA binding protein